MVSFSLYKILNKKVYHYHPTRILQIPLSALKCVEYFRRLSYMTWGSGVAIIGIFEDVWVSVIILFIIS